LPHDEPARCRLQWRRPPVRDAAAVTTTLRLPQTVVRCGGPGRSGQTQEKTMKTKVLSLLVLAAMAAGCASHPPGATKPAIERTETAGLFVLRTTSKTPDAVAEAIKAYAEAKKWNYLGADKVKQGQVILVKLCIPEIGQQLWPVGLQISAMLPCGNLGIYQKDGKTEISLLHPRYMQLLHPDPAVEKAGAAAAPLLIAMLDAVSAP
jgi:hypothetical protein